MFCSESSQVDHCTSGGLVSREKKPHAEIVFGKVVNNIRNLISRNSAVSTSSTNKQVSTKSAPHQSSSESDDDVQFTYQANKRKQPHRKEGLTSKQNQPESEEGIIIYCKDL